MVAAEGECNELPAEGGAQLISGPGKQKFLTRDAGALFVLESKGNWQHAGFHLSTSIAAPPLLSLPFAFAALGWEYGPIMLVLGALVTFYAYNVLSVVIEELANTGRRHLRFRHLAEDILGKGFGRAVGLIQLIVCVGAAVALTLLGGSSIKIIYKVYSPDGDLKLYHFIIIYGLAIIITGQLPSFHSLRYIDLLSLILTLLYSFLVTGASIYLGHSDKAPPKDYSLSGSDTQKVFGAFNSLVIIATGYGNGIIPEIQGTLAPPVNGKMFKGLIVAYAVVCSTYFSVAVSGYWAFGNLASGNIFSNFQRPDGTSLVPDWLIVVPNILVILQLIAVILVYSQPVFDIFEGKTADVQKHRFALRNWFPRLVVRSTYLSLTTLVAAMFPFFGDVAAIIGAFGFTPLDFVLPMLLYITLFKPPKRSIKFWGNLVIVVVYSLVGIFGAIAAVRQIVLDTSTYRLFADV
ncbi:hypothetical protein R1sor_004239 [Riccia sorocarpa]|uniref:Amino acid transporter transmembrane domain-containing protein n=1 Tax=Riccia sorocarpa TaxID=122646 RepID=A0ABD3H6R4_9MARC